MFAEYVCVLCVGACICMHTCGVCVAASGPVERVYLSAPIVTIRGKEANLTAVVWPSHTRTLTFFWWFDNSSEVRDSNSIFHSATPFLKWFLLGLCCFCCLQSVNLPSFHTNNVKCDCTWLVYVFLEDPARMASHIYLSRWLCSLQHRLINTVCQGLHVHELFYIWLRGCRFFCKILCYFPFEIQPIITLEGSISYTFQRRGKNKVTVQVASGSTIMQDSKVITVKGKWGRQSSKHFNWCDTHYMNMQYAILGKVRCRSVHSASNVTLMSTWTHLMNKMSRYANTKSWRAINFKSYVAKWKKTKLHIRLIKKETRGCIHTLTDFITSTFFQSSSGRCCYHSRQLLMNTILTSQSGGTT